MVSAVEILMCCSEPQLDFCPPRYQKLWKSYVKLRHLLANSPKVKQIDKQKLTQREVGTTHYSTSPWPHYN